MKATSLIGGFIAVAALGVVAGVLFAPTKGEKTRRKILRGSMKAKKNVVSYVDDSIDTLRNQVNEKIDQLAKRSKETVNHVSERVKV